MAYIDIDSNGVYDTWEPSGTFPSNPLTPTSDTNGIDITIFDSTADTDGDGLTDYFEYSTSGTSPTNEDTDGDSMWDGWEWGYTPPLDPLVKDGDGDPDSDGLTNAAEYVFLTDPTTNDTDGDLMDDLWESQYVPVLSPLTNDAAADPDGDTLTNLLEYTGWAPFWVQTDPTTNDTDGDSWFDNEEMTYQTDPTNAASFPADIMGVITNAATSATPGTVYAVVSNGAAITVTAVTNGFTNSWNYAVTNLPTLSNYTVTAYMDSNANATQDTWEVWGAYPGNPLLLAGDVTDADITMDIPTNDTDGDTLLDYDEVFIYLTDPHTNDTDGDLMDDGWEVQYMPDLDPTVNDATGDPDGDSLVNTGEYFYVYAGVTNSTIPTNSDTDADALIDGDEVTNGTDAHNPDTDADGLEDGPEVNTYGTSPTNDDTDVDGFTDYEEIVTIESVATDWSDPIVVDDDYPGDPFPGDPGASHPDEDGHLQTPGDTNHAPFDAIQEGINIATAGQVVVVMPGTYDEGDQGNGNINPNGKAIVIRAFGGASNTFIRSFPEDGFICNSGEDTNTVIKGFDIQTISEIGDHAGIRCDGSSPLIADCNVIDCGSGGMIFSNSSTAVVVGCLVSSNRVGMAIHNSNPRFERCAIVSNYAENGAGMLITGVSTCHIENCLIADNVSSLNGGGIYVTTPALPEFWYCTFASNTAGDAGGAIWISEDCDVDGSVVYGNYAPTGAMYHRVAGDMKFNNCILQESYPYGDNLIQDPLFVGPGDYQLTAGSPAIDPWTMPYPTLDLPGVTRPVDGDTNMVAKPDLGCYEYVPGGGGGGGGTTSDGDGDTLPDAWEDTYGLDSESPDGDDGADGDPDGDGFDNYSELVAGTDPGDAGSSLGILSLVLEGIAGPGPDDRTIQWSSVPGHLYHVEAVGSLVEPWIRISDIIHATNTTTAFTDTSDETPRFYRIYVYP